MSNLSDGMKNTDPEVWKSFLFDEHDKDENSQYFYARLYKQYGLDFKGKSKCNGKKCCGKCKKKPCVCKKK